MPKPVLLALISLTMCFAQVPSTAQQKAGISGTVGNAAGEPLKNATLRLQGQPSGNATPGVPAPPQMYAAASDAQGDFTFEDLEPGRYTLSADRSGYLPAFFQGVDLASGQKLGGIAMKMTPQALISGKVTDEYGDPYPRATVTVARWGYTGGKKRLQHVGGVTSDAEGSFAIGSLTAGSYYISASPQQPGAVNTVQKGPAETYRTTYYPSVTDPSGAIAVQLASGATARGLDIRLRKALSYRIRGKVIDLSSSDPPNTILRLTSKDGLNPPGVGPSAPVRDGQFEIVGVLPGTYILDATPFTSVAANGTRTPHNGMARQMVTVGDQDVDDLVVQLRPGAEITGKISLDSASTQQRQPEGTSGANALPNLRLIALEGQTTFSTLSRFNDDGTFAIRSLAPALYLAEVLPLPPGTYVKSIRFGSQDLMKTPLDLTSGSGGTIDVVLSPNAGDIAGIVHGPDGMPLAGVTVSLWTPGMPLDGVADSIRVGSTDNNGQFKFGSLAPGDYRVAAWEEIDPGLAAIPEFRAKFESKAASIGLNETAHENIEAPLIGRDSIQAEAAKLQ